MMKPDNAGGGANPSFAPTDARYIMLAADAGCSERTSAMRIPGWRGV